MFTGIRIVYVSPPSLAIPDEIVAEITAAGIQQKHVSSLDEAITEADVLYVTRIQKERFSSPEEYDAVCGSYCVDAAAMKNAKARMVVMHPLPRVNEISKDVDTDPRAAYFRQMANGMYMRMALLDAMIKRDDN
jgi:aspartate carbamoyltransferase catalytic subunit